MSPLSSLQQHEDHREQATGSSDAARPSEVCDTEARHARLLADIWSAIDSD